IASGPAGVECGAPAYRDRCARALHCTRTLEKSGRSSPVRRAVDRCGERTAIGNVPARALAIGSGPRIPIGAGDSSLGGGIASRAQPGGDLAGVRHAQADAREYLRLGVAESPHLPDADGLLQPDARGELGIELVVL